MSAIAPQLLEAAPHRPLADVAHQMQPVAPGHLDRVGMTEIEIPVLLRDASGCRVRVPARADAFVSLDAPAVKGIHMSRLYLVLHEILGKEELTPETLESVLRAFLVSHADTSESAHLALRFDYLVERAALRSANQGWRTYPVSISGRLEDGALSLALATRITYSSTCPCSAALARHHVRDAFLERFRGEAAVDLDDAAEWLDSESGVPSTPHSQRSHADVTVGLRAEGGALPLLDLIDLVEDSLGTPVQAAVKREDEQEFARRNGTNLMFCEDAARRIKAGLDEDPRFLGYDVRVEHQESLHPHNAVAAVSRPW